MSAVAGMLGLSDHQIGVIMNSARAVTVEKRYVFLQRIGAMLTLRGRGHFGDTDVQEVTALALHGLVQEPTTA
jgi:hypothetical protein